MSAEGTGSHSLVVRAWLEPSSGQDRLRVRILTPAGPHGPERFLFTTHSRQAACDAVCEWFDSIVGPRPTPATDRIDHGRDPPAT
jgi:hypothetical protein